MCCGKVQNNKVDCFHLDFQFSSKNQNFVLDYVINLAIRQTCTPFYAIGYATLFNYYTRYPTQDIFLERQNSTRLQHLSRRFWIHKQLSIRNVQSTNSTSTQQFNGILQPYRWTWQTGEILTKLLSIQEILFCWWNFEAMESRTIISVRI